MNYTIELADEQSVLAIEEDHLRALARATLEAEQVTTAMISLALVTDDTIHELNRRHLEHDYPTDVLSFLLESDPSDVTTRPLLRIEGEIVISTETALREALARGVSPQAEVSLYLVHGLLHLCGYDDHSVEDRSRMQDRERLILGQFKINPTYD